MACSKKRRRRAPLVVQVGSARALIYRETYRKNVCGRLRTYERFTVAHYRSDGPKRVRQRQSYTSLTAARFEATRVATAIANGDADVLKLKTADRISYLHSVAALAPLGIPLHVAIEEYVEAKKHAPSLINAAKEHGQRNSFTSVHKTADEVVQELIAAKEQDEMSVRYVESLRSHLNRFANHFQMDVSAIAAAEIEKWLRKMKRSPRTRNNIRMSIVTLFNFAKARGYLPKAFATEADHIGRARDKGGDIGVLRPEQFGHLLKAVDEEAKLYLSLGAFTGVRSAELVRLDWDDVNFRRAYVEVGKEKAKTATRRLVPIQPNLAQWLEPYRTERGRIFASAHATDRAIAQAKSMGIIWPNNALRHSYATYRLAQCSDAARVALEMGTSAQMLFRNYRELADEGEAAIWFSIAPAKPAGNVAHLSHALSNHSIRTNGT